MTPIDLIAEDRLAVAMCGKRIELAGTSIGTVAVSEFATFDFPGGGHPFLLIEYLSVPVIEAARLLARRPGIAQLYASLARLPARNGPLGIPSRACG